ncbi:MAG: cation-transporting P-type ATPase, partial [Alphaproteobacteria bacterium]
MNSVLLLPRFRRKANGSGHGNGKPKPLSVQAAREAFRDPDATLAALHATRDGLTDAEVQERLDRDGRNEVAHDKPQPWYLQLLLTLKNPFTLILTGLAIVSYLTQDIRAVFVLGTMIVLSVVMRFAQEYRSTRAAERLKALVRTTATVLRRASATDTPTRREVPIQDLVVGDIVLLSAGDMIPADVRLLSSRDLFVSQAILSGESIPVEKYDTLGGVVEKSASAESRAGESPLDLSNICYMGTNVVSGSAIAVVAATGRRTYFGSLAKAIVGRRAETAFDHGINRVTWVLIRFMAVMAPVVLLLNGFTKGDWFEAFLFAVSVA